ncbi:KGK domain-containing protein [Planktothrix pseudagardhii]|uniref:KGK family protein n=1 Tax=Planktothrix pseudagardhii TaxID=132604 RepID=A0A9W4CJD7_9CYAN|nr:KGK domain-containing protein [Planktothrix pseudagardhii]CAD5925504.1 hypothetical protein NO713_00944 [Planktothrix pseudagardhii]
MSDVVYSENCEDYEVLLFGNHTCLVEKLKQDLECALKDRANDIIESITRKQSNQSFYVIKGDSRYDWQWFEEGIECKLLKLGVKEWQPGTLKFKVTLQFCPEEPEEDEVDDEEEINKMDEMTKSLDDYEVLWFGNHTCLVERLKQDLECDLKDRANSIIESITRKQSNKSFYVIKDDLRYDKQWFEEGKECKILKLGAKEWQPGKVRIKVTLEFCPDEPEEVEVQEEEKIDEMDKVAKSLDDIRQKLNQQNNS